MRPLDIERRLKLPASGRILRWLDSAGENLAEICLRQAELRRKSCQVASSIDIVEGFDDGDYLATSRRVHGCRRRIASRYPRRNQEVDASQRSGRFRHKTWRWSYGCRCHCIETFNGR